MVSVRNTIDLLRRGEIVAARKLFEEIAEYNSDSYDARFYSQHVRDILCDWTNREQHIAELKDIFSAQLQGLLPIGNFPLCYLPFSISDFELAKFARQRELQRPTIDRIDLRKTNNKKIKVGILSIDFRSHSAGASLIPIFQSLKSRSIELYGYSFADETQSRKLEVLCATCFDNFKTLTCLTAYKAAVAIANDGIDILVDTTRHIEGSPHDIFKYHPADIQISSWGYGGTTGSSSFEYFLTDRMLTEEKEASAYSEKVIFLESYHPVPKFNESDEKSRRVEIPSKNYSQNLKNLASFNATYKLNPTLMMSWLNMLKAVSGSTLTLLVNNCEARENLRAFARRAGLSPDRLLFLDNNTFVMHINRIKKYSCVLDNPLMGGGGTFNDSMQAGVPVISFAGSCFAERSSKSLANYYYDRNMLSYSFADLQGKTIEEVYDSRLLVTPRQVNDYGLNEVFSSMIENIL